MNKRIREVETKSHKYTKKFRDSTVQLALNSDKSATQIAVDLDINPKTLYNWIRIYKKENNLQNQPCNASLITTNISNNRTKETIEAENKRLRAELKVVTMEREILKKAVAYIYTTTQSKAYRSIIYCENSHTLAKEVL